MRNYFAASTWADDGHQSSMLMCTVTVVPSWRWQEQEEWRSDTWVMSVHPDIDDAPFQNAVHKYREEVPGKRDDHKKLKNAGFGSFTLASSCFRACVASI